MANERNQRVIRVFVSSTFRDMHEEREELIKRIFPKLRKLCEQRGVTWVEVDLRWGINDEQKADGKVLPICLSQIDDCRPFFIGILGERYGTLPDTIPNSLILQYPWLKGYSDRSVTELEILHGALNDPSKADNAFFYFRNPLYSSLQPDFQESPTANEIEKFGIEQAQRKIDERREKLAELKKRIRESGLPVREDYENPKVLGELILADFVAVIDKLYSEGEQIDPLDKEAFEHEIFAHSRARVYIKRQEYFDKLDMHVKSEEPPLVVLGESGSGKSSLLANWALQYIKSHPDSNLILHFIGATPYSADWAVMLRRIMGELKRRFEINEEIPSNPDELRATFGNWLYMAAARKKVVIILDALNQLEDINGAPDLVWLPPELPTNVQLILSTLPGRPMDEINKRHWSYITVKPMEQQERKELIYQYLIQYGKELSTSHIERIAVAPQTGNPLYLRTLLEELRVYGDYNTLEKRMVHYLSAKTVDELYQTILQRYEEDYQGERSELVKDTMMLLWAARRGLSESELLELLGRDNQPLPYAVLLPLYLAAESSLINRAGVIGFFHDYFRQAIKERYLKTEESQHNVHMRLAEYFDKLELGTRKIDEQPWQLARAKEWKRLYDLLSDAEFVRASWRSREFEIKAYWAEVENNSDLRMVDAYRGIIDREECHSDYILFTAELLNDTGNIEEAQLHLNYLVEYFRETDNLGNLQLCLSKLGLIFQFSSEIDKALELYKEQEEICIKLGDMYGLAISLGNQANVLYTRGELDEAMVLQKEVEQICYELGDKDLLKTNFGNQALILYEQNDMAGAMRLRKEQERICREIGDKEVLARSLGGQAVILSDQGFYDEAMGLATQEEKICRELGDKYGLGLCMCNEAGILCKQGDIFEALDLYESAEAIFRELNDKESLSICLGNQGVILRGIGEFEYAMALHKEEEEIYHKLGDVIGVAYSLTNQARVLIQVSGYGEEAIGMLNEAYNIASSNEYDVG